MTSPGSESGFSEDPGAPDPVLIGAVGLAARAACEEAGSDAVGEHAGWQPEPGALTHFFGARMPGYQGWCWAVTLAHADWQDPVTVSEVVLLPRAHALVAPRWVPWEERVRPGDLGVGDLLPPREEDPRLVPAYLASDEGQVWPVSRELGLGRVHVLSFSGRTEAAGRWHAGEFGPRSDMAHGARLRCGTCGFYAPLLGPLGAAFGACGNELAPADGRVVHVEYGCGAHSELEVETSVTDNAAALVYDDTGLDVVGSGDTTPVDES
jgi:hypothetical protein